MVAPRRQHDPASPSAIRDRIAAVSGAATATSTAPPGFKSLRRIAGKAWRVLRRTPVEPSPVQQLIRSGQLVMGRFSYHVPKVETYAGDPTRVIIGSFCSMARGVTFVAGGNHRVDIVSSYPLRLMLGLPGALESEVWSKGDIVVGSDVWMGREAKVLSGVTIGHGAVVAAFSVVTKDVPPYAVVAGTPATVKRFRFGPEQVEGLLRVAWWDWDEALITQRIDELMSPDIPAFLEAYDPGAPTR